MDGWQIFGSVVASIVVGLLIKLVVTLMENYINVWLALLLGFIAVFGGMLLIIGVTEGV